MTGVPFIKYVCAINPEVVARNIKKIEDLNSELKFIVTSEIDPIYYNSFLQNHAEVRAFLLETFNEEIDEWKLDHLKPINEESSFGVKSYPRRFEKRYALVLQGEEIQGMLDASITNEEAKLETMFVSKKARNKGLGKWLVGALILKCIKDFNTIKHINTNTDQKNLQALKTLNYWGFFHEVSAKAFIDALEEELREKSIEENGKC